MARCAIQRSRPLLYKGIIDMWSGVVDTCDAFSAMGQRKCSALHIIHPIPKATKPYLVVIRPLSTRAHYLVTANCILCTFGPLTAYFPCPFTNQKLLARYRRGPTANAGPRRRVVAAAVRDRTGPRPCASMSDARNSTCTTNYT